MKATIEINSDTAHDITTYESDYPEGIMDSFLQDQDLNCVARMARNFGEDTSAIDDIMNKYSDGDLTWDDIKNMSISLSIGTIKCIKLED